MPSIKSKKVGVGSKTYDSPMSEIKTSSSSNQKGYIGVEGMNMAKAPSKGKKVGKTAKRTKVY